MRTIDFTTFGHRSACARNRFYKNFAPLNFYHLGEVVCYDLNFAVNRKGENVLEHSRTGSRTPTSGTGRAKSTRGGEKDIKVEPTP
jgi:hypothetical protein